MRQRTLSDFFWRDPQIYNLSQEDKATLIYFLTCPSSNIIGVYQVVWGIAAAEMGWTKDQILEVAKRLQSRGLINFDEHGWVWVKIWWQHNSAPGAFSPKLLKSSKKQCDAMPPEWLESFLKSVEMAGVDRVSIGYRYPIDTLPPNTTCNSISNTTTPETPETPDDLVFPQLNEAEKKSVLELLSKAQENKRQQLLDELAGAIKTNAIIASKIAFFRSLVEAENKSVFVPNRGLDVSYARRKASKTKTATAAQKIEMSEYGKSLLPSRMKAEAERAQTTTAG